MDDEASEDAPRFVPGPTPAEIEAFLAEVAAAQIIRGPWYAAPVIPLPQRGAIAGADDSEDLEK